MRKLNIEFHDSDQLRDTNKPKLIQLNFTRCSDIQFNMSVEYFNDLIAALQTIPGIISVTTKETNETI